MKVGKLVQWIAVAAVWVSIMVLLLIMSIFSMLLGGWSMPMVSIPLLFLVGVAGSAFIFTTDRFEHINQQIEEQIHELSDAEMLEVMQALDEVRDELGINIELPLKSKKSKRAAVDNAVRNLSDTELMHLKEQLQSGEVDEARLMAWLDAQREEQDSNLS